MSTTTRNTQANKQILEAVDVINNYIANIINSEKLCDILKISEEKFDRVNHQYRISSDSAIDYSDELIEEIAEALLS